MTNFRIEYANGSDIGKVRSENQDYFGAYETSDGHLFIVCDGMGGHEGGAEASKIAVESIKEYYLNANQEKTIEQKLKEAIEYANLKIYEVSRQRNYSRGMGTTVTAVVVKDGWMFYAHVGDSRIYLFRDGKVIHLTKDHTLVQQLVDMGKLTEEEAEEHPAKHQLLQALGVDEKVFVDVAGEPLKLQEGDYVLMCSDGLHGYVDEEVICSVVFDKEKNLMEKVQTLIQEALEAGGYDNITVQLIKVLKVPTSAKREEGSSQKKMIYLAGGIGLILLLAVLWWMQGNKQATKETIVQDTVQTLGPEVLQDTSSEDSSITEELLSEEGQEEEQEKTETVPISTPKDTSSKVPEKEVREQTPTSFEDSVKSSEKPSPKKETPPEKKAPAPSKNVGATIRYKVKQGEPLSIIAEKFCVPQKELMHLNSLSTPDNLQAGTNLKIPVKAKYEVKKGETLSEISQKYKVPMKKIMEINGIKKDTEVQAGQKLIIPKCKQ